MSAFYQTSGLASNDIAHEPGDDPREGLLAPDAALSFILAGNATFTAVSRKTGTRFTFKVQRSDCKETCKTIGCGPLTHVHFVRVLTGSDNETNYTYLGTIFEERRYVHGRKSRIGPDAPSERAFAHVFGHLVAGALDGVDIYHEGRCGRCGRKLTVPESITTGYGPECAGILGVR